MEKYGKQIQRQSAILSDNDRTTTSFTWPHLVSGFSANLNPSNLDPQKPTAANVIAIVCGWCQN